MYLEHGTIWDSMQNNNTLGWGKIQGNDMEIWDTIPVFHGEFLSRKDWWKLVFYPKKWFLYRAIKDHVVEQFSFKTKNERIRILDVGCGTGASVVDFKKMFGREVEVYGIDVIKMQIDLAREKIKQNGVWAEIAWYDGEIFPFESNYFDVIYSSDVLGHVKSVRPWLKEMNRVLKPGGLLAMFTESKLGRHAWVRNYLFKRGLNVDPHAEVHISLYPKKLLWEFIEEADFTIKNMRGLFWASFWLHPDEFYDRLQSQREFPILRFLNKILYKIKKRFHPYSTAWCELCGLIEALVIGKKVEAQGYIVLAKKK